MPSRFNFTQPDDEPLEGGVRSVVTSSHSSHSSHSTHSLQEGGTKSSEFISKSLSANGTPGPAETKLDLTELLHNLGMRYTHVFAIPGDALDDLKSVTPFSGSVLINNAGAALIVKGNVKADLELECVRSLQIFIEPTETEIDEQFILETRHNARQQQFVEAIDENSIGSVIAGSILDFGELIRQHLLLAIPLQPIAPEMRDGEEGGEAWLESESAAEEIEEDDFASKTHRPFEKLAELLKKQDG